MRRRNIKFKLSLAQPARPTGMSQNSTGIS